MGILKFACSRCWDYNCKCTPEELKEYDEQCKINIKKNQEATKQETIEKAAKEHADSNVFCDGSTDIELYVARKAFISGAKWMLEKLQDFDTWKEWKDINL
jgi:hypothetical protein